VETGVGSAKLELSLQLILSPCSVLPNNVILVETEETCRDNDWSKEWIKHQPTLLLGLPSNCSTMEAGNFSMK